MRCVRTNTRTMLHFSLNVCHRVTPRTMTREIGRTSIIVFINNVSPGLRNRRGGFIGYPNFINNSQASVRLPRMRHGVLGTLGGTNGGIVFIGYSNSTVTLIPRARSYSTVLRT